MIKKQYTRSLKSLVAMGKTYTTNKDLALELGRELDRTPIEFINPKLRETFLRAWPELGLPPINGKSVD
mgnify:FL=1|jgi:hypothetical protein